MNSIVYDLDTRYDEKGIKPDDSETSGVQIKGKAQKLTKCWK